MAPPSERLVSPVTAPAVGVCGECGALIGDVQTHTSWHAGADRADARQAIVEFLDSVDPEQLSQAALEVDPAGDPIAGALDVLKQLAARP